MKITRLGLTWAIFIKSKLVASGFASPDDAQAWFELMGLGPQFISKGKS